MTSFPAVEITVYPFECDAFGHLNHAATLSLFERARWEALAQGPGMSLFHRNGVVPAVRKATVEYRAPAFPGDVLRVETAVLHRGTTSWTLRQIARKGEEGTPVATAEIVFVCVDRAGRPVALPEEIAKILGGATRGSGGTHVSRVALDGVELSVDVRTVPGAGAVLFIHGFPLDHTLWRHQLAGLQRWTRIAPDLRGVGDSTAPDGGYAIARYADDLVRLLDSLRVNRAVVCGLSMGGYIAFDLVTRHADRVNALILCDTRPQADNDAARRARDAMAELARTRGVDAVGDEMLPRLLAGATISDQPEVVQQFREMCRRIPVTGMVGALTAMRDRADSSGMLGSIRAPTLVVVGSEDRASPPEVARQMADAIPGARLAVIPGAGHLAPLEQPLATTRALEDFLESVAV
ncbi:MAG TPA: alpha/beta fold hydrolase [Gemmatimonadales bacterium]|nr:alpha/beta fold hydrolase [Gemmatimonadales bacterium]